MEPHLAAIVLSSQDAILAQDASGLVTSFNPAAARLLGYAADEVVGRPAARLFGPGAEREVFERVLAGETVEAYDTVMVRGDGRSVPVSVSASPVRGPSGEMLGAATIARDITSRNEAQRELARVTAELRRSNQELEQFAYVASHDLSEPLRMVSGFVQLLQSRYEGRLDADADEFIAYMVDGVKRMRSLIDDLLQFSRVGREEIVRAPMDLAAVVDEVLASLAPEIEATGATVTAEGLPEIEADATAVRRIVQNLVSNALKFHGDEPPRIDVRARRLDAAWEVCVADRGIGIEPRHVERIFGIFQRLHRQSEFGGTGIGLAICKTLVERHGGTIDARPREGGGSEFIFTVPDEGRHDAA